MGRQAFIQIQSHDVLEHHHLLRHNIDLQNAITMFNIPNPKKLIFPVVFLVCFFLFLKFYTPGPGWPGLASIPGMVIFGLLIYSVWTIFWYICMRWPLVGIFIVGMIRGFFGGRGYRRW
jgi:hypothetical protein